jgi:hypothetical protein
MSASRVSFAGTDQEACRPDWLWEAGHSRLKLPGVTGLLAQRLSQASDNAVAMWSALARARGDRVLERPTFTAIDGRRFRVMVRTAAPDRAELVALVRAQRESGRAVVVEDPFRVLDLSGTGLSPRQLPVMVREPAPVPDEPGVALVRTAAGLRKAEDIIVHGFPLEEYQPLEAGRVFPAELRDQAFFIKGDEGACLTMAHGGVAGVYKLGFTTLGDADWWR